MASTEVKNNSQANNTSQTQAKTDSNKLQPLAPVNAPTQNKNFVTQDNKIVKPTKPLFKPATTLSIDAGAGYSLGWKTETSKAGSGISPLIGIRLNHSFTKNIALDAGLMYYGLTNLHCPYSSTFVSYGFGYNTSTTTVSPQVLNYLALPLEFQFHFNRNNAISLGATLLYMVNVASNVTVSRQNQLEASTSQRIIAFNFMDGFNQFDAQLVVAYRRRLFGRLGAGIEAYYGLFDVENNPADNTFLYNNTFERNSGFRIILSYDIIK